MTEQQHSRLLSFVAIAVAAAGVSGCFRAQAKTAPDMPPLDVPAPPPRIVETTEPEPLPPVPLVEEPARILRPRPPPAQQRVEPARPEPPRAESPPHLADAPPPADQPPRARPGTTLRTAPAEREAEFERGIRAVLARAVADLNRIDYGRLNPDARGQYEQAKRFVSQAEEALRVSNLMYAQNLADKAATLAGQLAGR